MLSLSSSTLEEGMGEGKGSTLVHVLVVVLSLVAFGFSIAAERRRSVVSIFFYLSLLKFFTFSDVIPVGVLLISTFLSKLIFFVLLLGLSCLFN